MDYNEAFNLIKEAKIAENEDDLCFQAAVILFVGLDSNWDLEEVHKATGYDFDNCAKIIGNFLDNGIIRGGKIIMDVSDNELNNIVELTCIALCGAGEIIRKELNNNNMSTRKTLNEHLFDQLDRLSDADQDNINIETTKAASIIDVAEKIITVAKLKLEIIQANAGESFGEIDNNTDQKQIGDGVKKK